MNLTLWKKTIYDSRGLLAGCAALLFVAHWLRVWIASYFSERDLNSMLNLMPDFIEQLMPVSISQVASSVGRIAVAYDDPIVLLTVTAWAIARGSDAVSGELNRGTMEMLLAQPVTRLGVLGTQAVATLGGAVLLAAVSWLGTSVGLAMITLEEQIDPRVFVPPAMNLFAITAFLAGATTMISAATDVRSRTIGVIGGFYAVSMIMKIIGRLVPDWHWLSYASFFTPFEPQVLASQSVEPWEVWTERADTWVLGGLGYDGVLIGLGLAAYLVAAVVFCRRDLPAPL